MCLVCLGCTAGTPATNSGALDSLSALGGAAPVGRRWVTEAALKQCAQTPNRPGMQPVDLSLPDSTEAIALGRAFLGARDDSTVTRPTTIAFTTNGVLVQFDDTLTNRLDGSNSVYIDRGRCITYLGW